MLTGRCSPLPPTGVGVCHGRAGRNLGSLLEPKPWAHGLPFPIHLWVLLLPLSAWGPLRSQGLARMVLSSVFILAQQAEPWSSMGGREAVLKGLL